MKMLPGQNKRLNALLTETGMAGDREREALVLYFTANRSRSRKDLEPHQAQALIEHLAKSIGQPGYTPPRDLVLAVQPPLEHPAPAPAAPAPKHRGRPVGTGRASAPKAPPTAEAADRMRRKIFAIGRAIGWLSGNTAEDRAMNLAKLNGFLERKSYLKKSLRDYAPAELPKLVTQFEQIERHVKKSATNREAGAAVAALLAELDLPTSPTPSPRKPSTR